jgi:diguanylate cyclase
VLKSFGSDPEKLFTRLTGLAKSWSDATQEAAKPGELVAVSPDVADRSAREAAFEPVRVGSDRDAARVLRELLARTLQFGVVERLGYSPALMVEAQALATRARAAGTPAEVEQFAVDLKQLWIRLELSGESQAQLMQALLGLVEMVLNNVGELVADDRWLHGQLERLRGLVSGPLEVKAIRDVELGFREVVYKQGTLKHGLDQAKAALKDLLATFIVRLGEVASHTGDYHDRISKHSERLKQADDIVQLGEILGQVMTDTRGIQSDMLRARDELDNSRQQAQGYEQRIVTLQQELEQVSALVREDPLTHVLNRRGFEEAWAVETARCERRGVPICLSVLDVDNFKNLNDRLGHVAGDDALVHLAGIVRATLRPSDVVARYGGEEFVILLPEVGLDEAMQVMVRVQRELTRRFFMYNNEKVLITFSAGVTERRVGEVQQVLVARADTALYEAKRTGKNRVIPA